MFKKELPPKWELIKSWKQTDLRLGQYFVNEYCKNSWPTLFYAKDIDALNMITVFYKQTQPESKQ